MNSTNRLRLLLFPTLTALFCGHSYAADRKPNIVVILADDLGCGDLSLFDGWIKTPRFDQMARDGFTTIDRSR